ncbi:glycosyltransferase [Streptomyces sp. PmtG]
MLLGDLLGQAHQASSTTPLYEDLRLVCAADRRLAEARLAPAVLTTAPGLARTHRPHLTAVILTHDEQDRIGDCLDALAEDADEVLLIDSGSRDRTLDIVEHHPMPTRIIHAPWHEDFARQRNLAFDHIHDGWILMVDADETLTRTCAGTIRRGLTLLDALLPGRDIALCPQIQDTHDPAGLYTDLPRVLRADTALRYRGRIHERPYDPHGNAPATIHITSRFEHHGYQKETIRAKDKLKRHTRLIELCRSQEPQNPKWIYYQVRAELPGITGPGHARELFDRLADSLPSYSQSAQDYLHERGEDTWALLCELALRFGGADEVRTYAELLDGAGRRAEAAYFRTIVTMSRTTHLLERLADDAAEALQDPGRSAIRDTGRLHELHGLLALASGRYDRLTTALRAARDHGAGSALTNEINRLKNSLPAAGGPS